MLCNLYINSMNYIKTMDIKREYLSIGEAADYLGISIDTIRRWDKKGKVTAYRSPGGHRYFQKNDLDKLFDTKYEREQIPSPVTKPTSEKVETVDEEKLEEIKIENLKPRSDPLEEKVEIITKEIRTQAKVDQPTKSLTEESPLVDDQYPRVASFSHLDLPKNTSQESEISTSIGKKEVIQDETTYNQKHLQSPASIPPTTSVNANELKDKEKSINNAVVKEEKIQEVGKKKYILIILLILFIIVDIVLAIVWYNSNKILSPIP